MLLLLLNFLIFYLTLAFLNLGASFFHEYGHCISGKYLCWYKDIKYFLNYSKIFWLDFIKKIIIKNSNSKNIKINGFTGYCEFDDLKYKRNKTPIIKEFIFSISGALSSITFLLTIGFLFYKLSNYFYLEKYSIFINTFYISLYMWIYIWIINEFIYNLNPKWVLHNDINAFLNFYRNKKKRLR